MAVDVAVLVSRGRHPVSGRPRRAPMDAQALEVGLGLAESGAAALHVLHAGAPAEGTDEAALRDYLGMGVAALHVIAVPAGTDPAPALIARLEAVRPVLVLTGMRSETGPSTGCLPYALAAALDYALVPSAVCVSVEGACARVRQALGRGRLRALRAVLPAVVTIAPGAPAPRQAAYARAARGRLVVESVPEQRLAPSPVTGQPRPARRRPPRLAAAQGATAAERLRAATSNAGQTGRIVEAVPAADAAREILAALVDRGLVEAAPRSGQAGAAVQGVQEAERSSVRGISVLD